MLSKSPRSGHSRLDQSPVIPKGDFWHKYSLALTLLGNAQNLAYAHPKLLAHCFDNVYFCGRIIGDLPARGRAPHSEERTKLIYDQEYEEPSPPAGEYAGPYPRESLLLNGSDISSEPGHCPPASRVSEAPWTSGTATGRGPEQKEYSMDGARGLIDLDWSQRTPIFHPDDIDRDPCFNQYPYPDDRRPGL